MFVQRDQSKTIRNYDDKTFGNRKYLTDYLLRACNVMYTRVYACKYKYIYIKYCKKTERAADDSNRSSITPWLNCYDISFVKETKIYVSDSYVHMYVHMYVYLRK